jgi:hypothetical protein
MEGEQKQKSDRNPKTSAWKARALLLDHQVIIIVHDDTKSQEMFFKTQLHMLRTYSESFNLERREDRSQKAQNSTTGDISLNNLKASCFTFSNVAVFKNIKKFKVPTLQSCITHK